MSGTPLVRALLLSFVVVFTASASAFAEWQVKPFFGATFGGSTTLIDLDQASGALKPAFGVTGTWLGEVIGIEADVGRTPGFFQHSDRTPPLVLQSAVTTLTGNVVIALPRHIARYTLRPYFVGGTGMMHATQDTFAAAGIAVSVTLAALDVGGGVTGFLSDRIGVNWEARFFRSMNGATEGISFGAEQLSFWRASMALAVRF